MGMYKFANCMFSCLLYFHALTIIMKFYIPTRCRGCRSGYRVHLNKKVLLSRDKKSFVVDKMNLMNVIKNITDISK